MSVRNLNNTLKTSLVDYDPFIVAHLIKFEKPKKSIQGATATNSTDFTYLTDAQYDIQYQDGSTLPNSTNLYPAQTYRANKILSLGSVNEAIQAKASNLSLTLDTSALGASTTSTAYVSNNIFFGNIDLSSAGFVEGDKVLLTSTTNSSKYVRIEKFGNDGKTIQFTPIDSVSGHINTEEYSISLASEELTSMLLDKSSTSYTSYINREVVIYRAHINPSTRQIIGEPWIYFKGIISGASITEKLSSSAITWTLSSHWGDFIRVQGRLTDDSTHRALRPDGSPDLEAVIKPQYSSDLGFLHSNNALNTIAHYTSMETRYKQVDVNGGWFGGKRLREIEVEVPRQVDLQFNIQAKMLPVVYGVRKIDSFPIFVDTHLDDSAKVFRADALCEGKIAGLLDIYVDDNSSICLDKPDFDVRNTEGSLYEEAAVEVVCKGRADRGDALNSYTLSSGNSPWTGSWTDSDLETLEYFPEYIESYESTINFSQSDTGIASGLLASGIKHRRSHTFKAPMSATLTFHAGLPDQKADSLLVKTAHDSKFKTQNDYYTGKSQYWGPSHKLLDTAYVVGQYQIDEGSTSLPELQFVVRGRDPECYNYDGSYINNSGHSLNNSNFSDFDLGDTVSIIKSNGDMSSQSVKIIDKWSTINSDGDLDYRFRFSEKLVLGTTTSFYMLKNDKRWYMQTWDHIEISSSVSTTIEASGTIGSSQTQSAGTSRGRKLVFSNNPPTAVEWALSQSSSIAGVYHTSGNKNLLASSYTDFSYNSSTNTLDNFTRFTSTLDIDKVVVKNAIKLQSVGLSNNTSDYIGRQITVTKTTSEGTYTQTRTITAINLSYNVALVDSPWDHRYIPSSGDYYEIGSLGDRRVTINPSMQLLDYMTNKRYGKGLNLTEIALDSWIEAAVECDTRAEVTIAVPSGTTIPDNSVWKYPGSGDIQFQGTVKSAVTKGGKKEVVFKDVIGKLGTKWNNWKAIPSGHVYWYNGEVYSGNGSIVSSTPTASGLSQVTLQRVDLSGTVNIDISVSASDGNPLVKSYDSTKGSYSASGYSLYDSDNVKYWKYLGWDDASQRNVTRHQMNQVVDTKLPIFENINRMLTQFNGILRYNAGKYELEVKGKQGVLSSVEKITNDDIIGDIKLSDKGLKNSKNYISTSIIDPNNKFEPRSVSFFNSDYLREDKGVQKKGQLSVPGITNYYNARFNIKQHLDESRYGLTLQLTVSPRGMLLQAGGIFALTYSRFGYNEKPFRITNVNFKKDGTVDITADEHNDEAFVIVQQSRGPGILEEPESGQGADRLATPSRPAGLSASQNNQGNIVLTWVNSTSFSSATHTVEIYRGTVNNFTDESVDLISTSNTNTYTDIIESGSGTETRYYWIRYVVQVPRLNLSGTAFRNVPSLVFPNTTDSTYTSGEGVSGAGQSGAVPRLIKLSAGTQNFVYNVAGTAVEGSPYATQTTITSELTNVVGTVTRVWRKNGTIITGADGNALVYSPATSFAGMPETIECEITEVYGSQTFIFKDSITFSASKLVINGSDGIDGFTITATNGMHNFNADSTGAISSVSGYSSSFNVSRGTTVFGFDETADPDDDTYKLGTVANVSPAGSVTVLPNSGSISISASQGNFLTGTSVSQATFDVPIINNNDGTTIAVFKFSLTKTFDGVVGTSSALVYAYKRASSAPSDDPGAVDVNLNTGLITTSSLSNGWNKEIPVHSADSLYVVAATAAGSGSTDTIAASEWSDPVKLVEDGTTARAVDLNAAQQAFNYDSSGTKIGTPTTTVTATPRNTSGDVYYEFFIDGTAQGSGPATGSGTNVLTYTPESSHGNMPQEIKVEIREGSSSGSVLASDSVQMFGVKAADDGTDAVNQKTVFVFKKNDSSIGFTSGNTAANQTFASPTTGLETGWNLEQPALTANNDKVYMSQRIFTSDGTSPQEAAWSSPVVISSRTDGTSVNIIGSVPSAATGQVRFKFEKAPHPDTSPSYLTDNILISGQTEQQYSVTIPSQGTNTFKSLLMYVSPRDVPIKLNSFVLDASSDGASTNEPNYSEVFGGATIGQGGIYEHPTGSGTETWGGFANSETDLGAGTGNANSVSFSTAGSMTFNASIPNFNSNAQATLNAAFNTQADPASSGDGVIAQDSGSLWIYNGTSWDDVGQIKGNDGTDAQNQKIVFLYKLNDNSLGFTAGNDAGAQTYDDPTQGLESGWSTTQPTLTANNDVVYQVQRLFTSDAASPQETTWSSSVVVARRTDGVDAQSQKTVFLYKKNDNTLGFSSGNTAANQTFASPTTGLESGWSTAQPALTANNDVVYQVQRLFTSDAASPQEAAWSAPVVVASRTDGVDGTNAVNQKTVFLFKKNDNTLGFASGNTAANQTFASPTTGLESGWSTTQPALTANNDVVYQVQRLFTSDASSPQEAAWSAPVVVASRTDGVDGTNAVNEKTVFVFKKNDSSIGFTSGNTAANQTFASPATGLENGWTTAQPALTANNDVVYMAQRLFTSDGNSPQEAAWSTPVVVASRTDGVDGVGTDGVSQKTISVFKKNDSNVGFVSGNTAANQTFASPTTGLENGWSIAQPSLSHNNDEVYMSQRIFTSDGNSPQEAAWSETVIVARRIDGDSPYSVIISNPAHTFTATSSGTVSSTTGSGTEIRVFKGNTELNSVSTTPTTGEFKVVVSGTNITPGSPDITQDKYIIGDHSSITADQANISYTIQAESLSTLVTEQSFSKAKAGSTGATGASALLIYGSNIINYDKNGANPNPSTTAWSVYTNNLPTGTVFYEWFINGISQSNDTPISTGSPLQQLTYTPSSTYSQTFASIAVTVRVGSSTADIVAQDVQSIASLKSGSDGVGTDGVSQKTISVFKKNDPTLGFTSGNTAANQTFASPTTGLENDWSTTQPALTANNDVVYVSRRIFTSDGNSPQEAAWSTPVAVARRTDGVDGVGTDAVNEKTVFVFKKNDTTLGFASGNTAANQTFASPTTGLESGWSNTQPALTANNDKVYMAQRVFTSNGSSPQEAAWSTPVVVASRTDGDSPYTAILSNDSHTLPTLASGTVTYTNSGTSVRVFKGDVELDSTSNTPSTGQFKVTATGTNITPSNPTGTGLSAEYGQHSSITATTAKVSYSINCEGLETLTKIQSLSKAINGSDGTAGLNSASVFIYKRTNSNTEDTKPTGTSTYTFASGALAIEGTTNNWSSSPPSGTDQYLWYRTATAASTGITDTILTGEWSSAQLLSISGQDGGDGHRGGLNLSFSSAQGQFTTFEMGQWASASPSGTNATNMAVKVAALVIAAASDGKIRPNDRITCYGAVPGSVEASATRIYTGSATSSSASVGISDYSSLVEEIIDGSLIINGTLSADAITSGEISSGTVKISNNLEVAADGKIFTTGKDSYTDTDAGLFIGQDSSINKFYLGDANNYLKWNGTGLEIKGSIQVGGTNTDANSLLSENISLLPGADDSDWVLTSATTKQGIWTANGASSENSIQEIISPRDNRTTLGWVGDSTDGCNADGGFQNTDSADRFEIEDDTFYRFSGFIYQTNTGSKTYLGAYNYNSSGTNISLYDALGEGASTNKYWKESSDLSDMGVWKFFVCYINPSNTSYNSTRGGLYDPVTGEKEESFLDFRFHPSATKFSVRTYQYYAPAASTAGTYVTAWAHPRVDRQRDGINSPSIHELMGRQNNETYINGGSIKTGEVSANFINLDGTTIESNANGEIRIKNLAIDSGKIANTLESSNYSSGAAGWKILKTGNFYANSGYFRGEISSGGLNVASGGSVRSGKSSYLSGTAGFFIGTPGGTGKFNVGNSSKYVKWTGSSLIVNGATETVATGTIPIAASPRYIQFGNFSTFTLFKQIALGVSGEASYKFYIRNGNYSSTIGGVRKMGGYFTSGTTTPVNSYIGDKSTTETSWRLIAGDTGSMSAGDSWGAFCKGYGFAGAFILSSSSASAAGKGTVVFENSAIQ